MKRKISIRWKITGGGVKEGVDTHTAGLEKKYLCALYTPRAPICFGAGVGASNAHDNRRRQQSPTAPRCKQTLTIRPRFSLLSDATTTTIPEDRRRRR
jgi:hypothetical protein